MVPLVWAAAPAANIAEAEIKQAMLRSADYAVFLADHTKIGNVASDDPRPSRWRSLALCARPARGRQGDRHGHRRTALPRRQPTSSHARIEDIVEYAEAHSDRPLILCEYSHAMGYTFKLRPAAGRQE